MSYYYTLGYSDNPIISKYYDLYYEKLLSLYTSYDLSNEIKEKFSKLSQTQKYNFLCKSDISYLINDIDRFKSQDSLNTLQDESDKFLDGREAECMFSLGNTIPETNIKLTTFDHNKGNNVSTHPDHESGNMIGWGEKTEQEWMDVYANTFRLLKSVNKDFYNELNFIIQKIVPFNTSARVHNSATHKENIGSLYLGFTIDVPHPELCILEALIHESSHNKLNLIMHTDELILSEKVEKYYSPYRPDARHLYGIYLGVHALVITIHTMIGAVREGYILDIRWHEKIMLYHFKNRIGMKVLRKYVSCTPLGYQILDELDEIIQQSNKMIISIPEFKRLDFKTIQGKTKKHFLDVQRDYPHLQY